MLLYNQSLGYYIIDEQSLVYLQILFFAWEDQSNAAYRIVHTVLISCITALYESYSTVMQLIGRIQYSYAENLFVEYYVSNTL